MTITTPPPLTSVDSGLTDATDIYRGPTRLGSVHRVEGRHVAVCKCLRWQADPTVSADRASTVLAAHVQFQHPGWLT